MKKAFLLPLLMLSTVLLVAQTIDTDRPTQGASAIVIPQEGFQIEAGLAAAKTTNKGNDNYEALQFAIPTTTLRYAFVKNVEVRLVAQINRFEEKSSYPNFGLSQSYSETGISDLQVGFKFQLLNKEDRLIKLGWLTNFIVPAGSDGFSSESFGINNRLLISHKIDDSFSFGYNLGHTYYEYGYHEVFISIAATYKLKERFGFFIEEYAFLREGYGSQSIDHRTYINGGVTFLAKETLQLDLSFGTNLDLKNDNYSTNTRFISAGVSWLIQKKQ